jgi:type IV pilus modification protein PilV
MKYLSKTQTGFTLIEILVAILVFAIGMLGLARLQGVTILNSAESRMQTHAANLAQDKIEELRNYIHAADYTNYASNAVGTDVVGANATFTRTWSITNNAGYKEISVLVEWTGVDDTDYDVRLTSHIAEVEPARSGMILAAVPLVGITAADAAAQAAAHAAAAAVYHAIVTANFADGSAERTAADQALADAQAAADAAAQAAADGDIDEAQAQAEIAYQKMSEILAIVQSLDGELYEFSGDVFGGADSVLVSDGTSANACVISGTSYTCAISTVYLTLNVTASRDSDGTTDTCEVPLVVGENPTGCTLSLSESCSLPWGGTIEGGELVTAYNTTEATLPSTCSSVQRECDGDTGLLGGDSSYQYQTCTQKCTVPSYNNQKKSDVPAQWNTTGPGTINKSAMADGTPASRVASQSPAAAQVVACTTTVVVDD